MYVRLAFAVAAHLEPEILLVDEVLAVGDAEFQQKCLGKMDDVAAAGGPSCSSRTSSARCSGCARGRTGSTAGGCAGTATADVVAAYLHHAGATQQGGVATIGPDVPRSTTGAVTLERVALLGDDGAPTDRIHLGQPFTVAA